VLDLNFTITADGSQAKAEMRSVDAEKKKLESSLQRSTAWWQKEEAAIDDVTGTLITHRGEVSRVEAATAKMEQRVAAASTSTKELGVMSTGTTAALMGMSGGSESAAASLLQMTGAAGLSVGALTALAGAIAVVVAAGLLFGKFLVDSAQHYIEHGKGAQALRDELDRLGATWNNVKLIVGESLIAPEQSALIGFLKLGEEWAMKLGLQIAANIELLNQLYSMTPGGAFWGRFGQANDLGTIPDPAKVLGGKHPLGSYLARARDGAYEPMSGAQAQRLFDQQEAERKRQELAAAKERERLEREIAAAYQRHFSALRATAERQAAVRGMAEQNANFAAFGAYAARLPIAAGFGAYGLNPLTYALPPANFFGAGTVREDFIGAKGLDPSKLRVGDVSNFFGTAKSGPSFLNRMFGSMAGGLGNVLTQLLVERSSGGSVIGSSIGGSIFGSLMQGSTGKSISGGLSGLFGKTIGGALGSFIPFGGQILGSLIGKMFGPTQYQQRERQAGADISALWASMNKQYGGDASQALSIFGFNPNELKGKNYQGAMGLDPLRAQFDELAKRQGTFNTGLGDTLSKIQALGGGIPEALRPYLQQLANAKVLTQDNLDLIAKMTADAVPSYQQMEEAANRLGISTDALGQAFQNAKAAANWQSVIDDLDTLIRGGADMNALLGDEGLQKKFNDLVQQSIKFGTAIPENMKPWIQALIDSGKLLGANGEKIEDINQLKFGETMQTTLEKLNATLKELIDALNVALPDATKKAAGTWREQVEGLPPFPSTGGGRGGDGGGGGTTGGRDAPAAYRQPVVIQMDGRAVGKGLVPIIPGIVTRAGLSR
jgi:hypothetical protein